MTFTGTLDPDVARSISEHLLAHVTPLATAGSIDEFALQWNTPFATARACLEYLIGSHVIHVDPDIRLLDELTPFDWFVDLERFVDVLFVAR